MTTSAPQRNETMLLILNSLGTPPQLPQTHSRVRRRLWRYRSMSTVTLLVPAGEP